jgi:hypothetical protein
MTWNNKSDLFHVSSVLNRVCLESADIYFSIKKNFIYIYIHTKYCHNFEFFEVWFVTFSACNISHLPYCCFFNLKCLRFLVLPQNKILYFKDECEYAKYMVLTIFLLTTDLIVLIAEQSLQNLSINFSTWHSQFKLWC